MSHDSSTVTTTSFTSPTKLSTFPALCAHLLSLPHPLQPPTQHSPHLTSAIAALRLHPALEAALHLLNADLPSAHFLVRQMQAPPAYEGMYLHGILHRLEGDFNNARAWYGLVGESEIYRHVWGEGAEGREGDEVGRDGKEWVERCERWVKMRVGEKEGLERENRAEMEKAVEWCRRKFGEGEWLDASGEYAQPQDDERKKVGRDMITGGEGWRQF